MLYELSDEERIKSVHAVYIRGAAKINRILLTIPHVYDLEINKYADSVYRFISIYKVYMQILLMHWSESHAYISRWTTVYTSLWGLIIPRSTCCVNQIYHRLSWWSNSQFFSNSFQESMNIHEDACIYLNPGFCESDPQSQLLAHKDVRIMCLRKSVFQFVDLCWREACPMSLLLASGTFLGGRWTLGFGRCWARSRGWRLRLHGLHFGSNLGRVGSLHDHLIVFHHLGIKDQRPLCILLVCWGVLTWKRDGWCIADMDIYEVYIYIYRCSVYITIYILPWGNLVALNLP